ncbi:MAG: hypothetical protein HY510_01800 [Acidobacteria bacterium]|nr:hypothetical protein [Acidobacteriota bacterium]
MAGAARSRAGWWRRRESNPRPVRFELRLLHPYPPRHVSFLAHRGGKCWDRGLGDGGLFICDNLLWFGKVAGPDQDDDTRGVRELTRLLCADPGLHTTIVPLRDGVGVSLRL